VYVLTRRDVTAAMIRAAEAAGYRAIVVTVDAPRLGKREQDERNAFSLPPGLSLRNLERIPTAAVDQGAEGGGGREFGRHFGSLVDASLTWDVVPWVKSITSLPVLVKGVLAPDDARRAVEAGAAGIILSNHGGRQLDFTPAALDVLPHVAAAVRRRVPVLVDGGVRRGTDVIKCLALGASAVLVGRPVLWALALGGQPGVEAALAALRGEVELGMALLGCSRVSDLSPDFVLPPTAPPFRIPASRL
jgi:(S)-2-hydroxy-acid oxidase